MFVIKKDESKKKIWALELVQSDDTQDAVLLKCEGKTIMAFMPNGYFIRCHISNPEKLSKIGIEMNSDSTISEHT